MLGGEYHVFLDMLHTELYITTQNALVRQLVSKVWVLLVGLGACLVANNMLLMYATALRLNVQHQVVRILHTRLLS